MYSKPIGQYKTVFYLWCGLLMSSCVSIEVPPLSPNEALVAEIEEVGLTAKETDRGVVIYLPSVNFDFESAELSDNTKKKVKYIAAVFNKNALQDRNILIEGHADSAGPEKYNMQLSKKRANAVAVLLKEYGVKAERLGQAWYGETRPLVPNRLSNGADNPQGRSVNRRVEFIVLNASSLPNTAKAN